MFQFFLIKDVVVSAAVAIGLGFMAVAFGSADGKWAVFLIFFILAAGFAYFSFWSWKNLLEEIEEQEKNKKKKR